ncbi:MAG: alpha/beta fold hydrolase, partial [Bacteroidota bacterium]
LLSHKNHTNNTCPHFFPGLNSKKVHITTGDGVELQGYFIQPNRQPRAIMILIHGIGGCKEGYLGLADRLAKSGYASYLFDNRAQGKSGGKYCSYGFYEKGDIQGIIGRARQKFPDLPIGVWGNSLGGAIALQTLAIDDRLSFGVVESTFGSLGDIVYEYQKRYLKGVGLRPITDYALYRAGKIANFPPSEVCPADVAAAIHQPVLLAHGDADPNIDIRHGKEIYKNLASEGKEWVEVSGGGHSNLFAIGGEAYAERIMSFIARQVGHVAR